MGRAEAAQAAVRPASQEYGDRETVKFTEPGQEVYGIVAKVALGVGKKGDIDLIEVDDEELGEITVFLGNLGLQQGLVEGSNNLGRPVQKGDTVYIRFDGEEVLEHGNTFKHYAVYLEGGGARAKAASKAAPSGANKAAPAPVDDEELPF